jgi:Vault protein inter-alpha-trypsin domain
MITTENQSDASPDDLTKTRGDSPHGLTGQSDNERHRHDDFDHQDIRISDSSLAISRFLAISALLIIGLALLFPQTSVLLFAGWGILLLYCVHTVVQERQKREAISNSHLGAFSPLPKSTTLWGLAIPLASLLAVSSFVPLHAIDESTFTRWTFYGILSLACCAVASNALHRNISKPKSLALLNGLAFGLSLGFAAIFAMYLALVSNPTEFSLVLPITALMLFYCGGLAKTLLLKVDRTLSLSVFSWTCVTAVIASAFAIGPELRSFAIAIGEKLAVSQERSQVDMGYQILRQVKAGPELDVAANRYANGHANRSLTASLLPVDSADAEKMYFVVTGKAHTQPESVVGRYLDVKDPTPSKVDGLTLAESKVSGVIDANSLTSVMYWTMVFGNQSEQSQEAQAKIALPPGAAVSRVTLWVNGIPQEAAFNSTQRVTQAYEWITQHNRDPILVTETAPGVISLQAFPVPKFGEMKIRIGITAPLNAQSKRDFTFTAPRVISSNFGIEDSSTELKLESNASITSTVSDADSVSKNSQFIYTAQMLSNSAKPYQFAIHRKTDFTEFSARATHSKEDMVIKEKMISVTNHVNKLAVVVDGSDAINQNRDDISRALAAIPKGIETRVMLANQRDAVETLSVKQAIDRLPNLEYTAGCDDTKALLAARKYVGRDGQGAIVWIHGPQPIVLEQDKRPLFGLMNSGEHKLKVYEYQSDAVASNAVRSYLTDLDRAASPDFQTISADGSVEQDLTGFFKNTFSKGEVFKVQIAKIANKHADSTSYDFPVSSRVSTIWAADEARKCVAEGDTNTAVLLGTAYRVVTPATGAVVMERESDYAHQNLERKFNGVVDKKAQAFKAPGAIGGSAGSPSPSASPVVRSSRHASRQFENRGGALVPTPALQPAPPPVLQGVWNGAIPPADRNMVGSLQGITNGTIGPQGRDQTMVTGVNTAGTVRVNEYDQETKLFLFAQALKILGILFGSIYLFRGLILKNKKSQTVKQLIIGSALLMAGVISPTVVNMLVGVCRDSNWFM